MTSIKQHAARFWTWFCGLSGWLRFGLIVAALFLPFLVAANLRPAPTCADWNFSYRAAVGDGKRANGGMAPTYGDPGWREIHEVLTHRPDGCKFEDQSLS